MSESVELPTGEMVTVSETKPKRKRGPNKLKSGVIVKVGSKLYKGDSYSIGPEFLTIKRAHMSTYVALANVTVFTVEAADDAPMAYVSTSTPTVVGGPANAIANLQRNRALTEMMGPSFG